MTDTTRINRDAIAAEIAEMQALPRSVVDGVLKLAADRIAAHIAIGTEVHLHGFGTFSAVDTPPRDGRNPATGEAVAIPAGRRPKFKPAKALKDAVALRNVEPAA